jgi:hypothetical protein
MTLFGKILVFIILAISVMMGTAGFALWSNRIDWSDHPAKGQEPAGVLAERQAEVKELWDGIASARREDVTSPYLLAERTWRKNRTAVEEKEKNRPNYRRWYRAEIAHLRSGATAMNPAREVVLDPKTFVPAPDPQNPALPQMKSVFDRDGKTPLLSLAAYNDFLKTLNMQLETVIEDYKKLVQEDQDLTLRLIGDPNKDKKGLRVRVADERIKRQGVEEEIKLVKPQLINTNVQGALIVKRRNSLKARIAELEKVPVAARNGN